MKKTDKFRHYRKKSILSSRTISASIKFFNRSVFLALIYYNLSLKMVACVPLFMLYKAVKLNLVFFVQSLKMRKT